MTLLLRNCQQWVSCLKSGYNGNTSDKQLPQCSSYNFWHLSQKYGIIDQPQITVRRSGQTGVEANRHFCLCSIPSMHRYPHWVNGYHFRGCTGVFINTLLVMTPRSYFTPGVIALFTDYKLCHLQVMNYRLHTQLTDVLFLLYNPGQCSGTDTWRMKSRKHVNRIIVVLLDGG